MRTATQPATLHLLRDLHPDAAAAESRWEWRVFARGMLPLRDSDLPTVAPADAVRQETYLLSAATDHVVSVRDGQLRVRRLERLAPGDLELWSLSDTSGFPVSARIVHNVCDAWGVRGPVQHRLAYSIGEFEFDVVRQHRAVHPVVVTKRRTRLELLRCAGERVELLIAGERWESVAFRDTDAARVRAVVNHLGLGHLANVNYAAALRRIAGVATERRRA